MKQGIVIGVAGIAALTGSVSAGLGVVAPDRPYAPDRVIVSFEPGASAVVRAEARAAAGARGHDALSPLARNTELLAVGAGRVQGAIVALRRSPGVRFAEPDWVVTPSEVSNDAQVTGGRTWGLYGGATSPANSFGSAAMAAWGVGRIGSRSIAVGIIDTGIDISHPDLAANMWSNPGEVAGDRVDNDANGYVDDVRGWDFHNNDATVYDAADGDNHGTHVAGTIGAVGGNGIGVAGVNWSVTMIPAKFLGPNGGYISNAVKAADYLTAVKTRTGLNVVATNNSWGGGGFSQAMLDAINRAGDRGILFVAAAGNGGNDGVGDNNDSVANYPSNYRCTTATRAWDCVVAVAAIRSDGTRATFSNYGASTVELGAPGQDITSSLPGNTYGSYSGTSMATPHVTGALALCRSSFPFMGADAARQTLLATAAPTSSLTGLSVSGGRLDAKALSDSCVAQYGGAAAPSMPSQTIAAPSAFGKTSPTRGATGLGTQVNLKWQAAVGASSYEACIDTTNDGACAGNNWTSLGNVTSATARLSAKTTYYWQVRAVNTATTVDADGGAWWTLTTK